MPNKTGKIKCKFWIYVDLQEDSLYFIQSVCIHGAIKAPGLCLNLQWVLSVTLSVITHMSSSLSALGYQPLLVDGNCLCTGEGERCYISKIKHASIVSTDDAIS